MVQTLSIQGILSKDGSPDQKTLLRVGGSSLGIVHSWQETAQIRQPLSS